MKSSDQAVAIGQQYQGMSHPEVYVGMVSPCTTCLNQRSITSADGKPPCPRRVAASQKLELDNNNMDSTFWNLVVLTGVQQGQQDDGTKPLANPVYDNASNSILVWAAAFKDNGPTIGPSGNLLSPDILDPNFSSDWLQCKPLPYTPRDSEAQYFQKGCLMQGDQVEISGSLRQQVTANPDGTSQALPLGGTVHKVNASGQYPLQPVSKDLCVSGL
jgi:hypothetical protein